MPLPVRLAAAVVVAAATLTGCGSASAPSPPSGVDELVIPTPDPDPADFVDRVDNPLLPAVPGARWEYDATDASGAPGLVTVTAEEGVVHAGITTTTLVRVTEDRAGRETGRVVDHLAQDRDGNVWWLGRDDRWFPEPGLVMPADPRLGDGFLMAELPEGVVRAEVADVDTTAVTPAAEYDDVVVIDVLGDPAGDERRSYAPGVGLVRTEPLGTTGTTTGLVAFDEPR